MKTNRPFRQVAFMVSRFLAVLFFAIGALMILVVVTTGEYVPGPNLSADPSIWAVMWDARGFVLLPAFYIFPGVVFWWLGSLSKPGETAQ
jgi:hypothetical protein